MPTLPETITFNGETLSLTQWAARLNLSAQAVRNRISAGWPLGDALTQPRGNRGMSSYQDSVVAERRRYERARMIEMNALRRDFKKLVHDIDRALNAFNHRLAAVSDDTPGVPDNFAENANDRATRTTQDCA